MTEVKEVKKVDNTDKRLNALEGKVNAMGRILDRVKVWAEKIHGADIDGDGKIGGAKIGVLVCVFILALTGLCVASEYVADWASGSSLDGTANIEHDGSSAFTLNINAVEADGTLTGVSSTSGTGTISTSTAADTDYGNMRKTVLTMADVPLLITCDEDETNAWGSVKLYDFPAGRLLIHGVTVSGVLLDLDTDTIPIVSGGDWAIGTVAASSNVLTSTMVDFAPSTSLDPLSYTGTTALAASAQMDGTTTAKDLYFNFGLDQDDFLFATNNPATNSVSGVITIHWTNLGDY